MLRLSVTFTVSARAPARNTARVSKPLPKKTTTIYARVPDDLKAQFRDALARLGFTEAFYVRAVAEALIAHVAAGDDLSLPIRLLTVDQRRERAKKKRVR